LDFVQLLLVLLKVGLHGDAVDIAAVVEGLQDSSARQQVVLGEQSVQAVDDNAAVAVGELEALAQDLHDNILGQNSAHIAELLAELARADAQLAGYWAGQRGRSRGLKQSGTRVS